MKLKKFKHVLENTPQGVKEQVKLSLDILDRINYLLDKKFEGKQKLLADKMGKSEAEVSKWFNGVQNFTIKTLSKLSAAFEESIVAVSTDDGDTRASFELVKTSKRSIKWVVNKEGIIAQEDVFITDLHNLNLNKNLKKDLPA